MERLQDWESNCNIVRKRRREANNNGDPIMLLANVESIVDTATVADNIGSSNGFLYVEKRSEWRQQWVTQMEFCYGKYIEEQEAVTSEEEDDEGFEEKFTASRKAKEEESRKKSRATRERNCQNREANRK